MEFWDRLRAIFRTMRGIGLRHYELNDRLQSALAQRADQEQRTTDKLHEDLLETGLAHLQASDKLKAKWNSLSPRERETVALTCLKYTNRQMAAMMKVSPDTVKGYIRQALVKFNVHSKDELRMMLELWDFSKWGPEAEE